MYLTLRIVFTILSALCIAAAIPVGVFAGLTGVLVCAGLAFMFYLVMLTFKLKHESLNPQTEESDSSQAEIPSSDERDIQDLERKETSDSENTKTEQERQDI